MPSSVAYIAGNQTAHGELPERIYARLRDEIIRGRLEPESRVVEADLALRFGVSRTPVREALERLARERYLVPAGSGRRTQYRVTPLVAAEVAELWGLIGALEGHAIQAVGTLSAERLACLASELEALNANLEGAVRARPRDNEVVSELMNAFHECFMNYCAGPLLRMLYDPVRAHVQRYEWAYGSQADAPYAPSIAEHRRIIAAVSAGDAQDAREAIEQHWANGVQRTNTLIARVNRKRKGAR